MAGYRSIFLARDWRHARYLGWSDRWPTPDMRVLTRRAGPIARALLVSTDTDAGRVIREARRLRRFNAEVTVRDLARLPAVPTALERMSFAEIGADRMLNRFTGVIDLRQEDSALLAAMSPDTRRQIRMAERHPVDYRVDAQDDAALLDLFFRTMDDLSRTRHFQPVDRAETLRHFAEGAAHLYAGTAGSGDTVFLQTYEAGDVAMYLHGATAGRSDNGLGRALQWFAIRDMRARYLRWYDLGGLPSLDPHNGITRFKLGFGGEVVDLGPEYRWSGPLAAAARRSRAMWHGLRRA